MHFLIDADLPRSVKPLIERYRHNATDVRDIGLTSAKDPQIAMYAQNHNLPTKKKNVREPYLHH